MIVLPPRSRTLVDGPASLPDLRVGADGGEFPVRHRERLRRRERLVHRVHLRVHDDEVRAPAWECRARSAGTDRKRKSQQKHSAAHEILHSIWRGYRDSPALSQPVALTIRRRHALREASGA